MQNITLDQKIPFTIVGLDQFGNPFPIPTGAVFAASNDDQTVATTTPGNTPDETVTAVGVGTTDVKATVTLADGVTVFNAADTVVVGPSAPPVLSGIALQFGAAVPK